MDTEKENVTLKEENKALAEKLATADAKIKEDADAGVLAEAQSVIKEAINGTDTLPDASKAKLIEAHKADVTADGIAESIKAELDYVSTITEGAKPKGMGKTEIPGETSEAAMIESAHRLRPDWTDEQCKTYALGR